MATYKDDLDIIKAAEKDSSKLSLNAITELDNKGMLGMYGGGGSGFLKPGKVTIIDESGQPTMGVSFIKVVDIHDQPYISNDTAIFTAGIRQREIDFVYPSVLRILTENSLFDESNDDDIVVREDNMVLHIVQGSTPK